VGVIDHKLQLPDRRNPTKAVASDARPVSWASRRPGYLRRSQ